MLQLSVMTSIFFSLNDKDNQKVIWEALKETHQLPHQPLLKCPPICFGVPGFPGTTGNLSILYSLLHGPESNIDNRHGCSYASQYRGQVLLGLVLSDSTEDSVFLCPNVSIQIPPSNPEGF